MLFVFPIRAKGFDFLGYYFSPEGLRVATKTVANFVARVRQLYEHEPGRATAASRLGVYVRRWVRWVRAGVPAALRGLLPTLEAAEPETPSRRWRLHRAR